MLPPGSILGTTQYPVEPLRRRMLELREQSGVKVTYTHMAIKAMAMVSSLKSSLECDPHGCTALQALRACPTLNGRIIMGEYHESPAVDISVLVMMER